MMPMSRIVSAMVTVSAVPGGAPLKLRMMRSRTSPTSGAKTNRMSTSAMGVGTSQSTCTW
jgi:hypothetical protein